MNSRVLHNLKHSISFRRARFKMKQNAVVRFRLNRKSETDKNCFKRNEFATS